MANYQTEAEMLSLLMESYKKSPSSYARQVLKSVWWKRQVQISLAVLKYKKVFVMASHAVGKSHIAAGLTNWHYDCFNPSITITTAPSQNQVERVLWKEIRQQRGSRNGKNDLAPKAPMMGEFGTGHFAIGMTAHNGDAFQGSHEDSIGLIYDEAVGIEQTFWESGHAMMTNANEQAWFLAICNPTDTQSPAYQEVLSGQWYVMDISAMSHPNIEAAIQGEPLPYPTAVGIGYIDSMVKRYCQEIQQRDMRSGDISWILPDGDGKRPESNRCYYRPGPMMESRVLGRWPSNATSAVWSDAMWKSAERRGEDGCFPIPDSDIYDKPCQIGCDVAWGGSDYTSIISRRGHAALTWETHNGWKAPDIAQGLKDVALDAVERRNRHFGYLSNYVGEEPRRVLMVVDHDATGYATLDHLDGWNVVTQSGQSPASDKEQYPNKRSENWFSTAGMADLGLLDFSRLPVDALKQLRAQLMSPTWTVISSQRVVEQKVKTRRRLKRSPDDADALNLAFCEPTAIPMSSPAMPSGLESRMTKTDGSAGVVHNTQNPRARRRASPTSLSGASETLEWSRTESGIHTPRPGKPRFRLM